MGQAARCSHVPGRGKCMLLRYSERGVISVDDDSDGYRRPRWSKELTLFGPEPLLEQHGK
jgi:hypothetical protein